MEIALIGNIDFKDIKINVYYDVYNEKGISCIWQMRNPDSCYTGVMYRNNETGKCSYPEDAIIPKQTDRDREILPKFIIVGKQELDDKLIKTITTYLETEYFRRNKTLP